MLKELGSPMHLTGGLQHDSDDRQAHALGSLLTSVYRTSLTAVLLICIPQFKRPPPRSLSSLPNHHIPSDLKRYTFESVIPHHTAVIASLLAPSPQHTQPTPVQDVVVEESLSYLQLHSLLTRSNTHIQSIARFVSPFARICDLEFTISLPSSCRMRFNCVY